MLRIYNGRLLTAEGLTEGEIWCEDGKIIPPQQSPTRTVDAKGLIIAPGYIDLQINGAYGVDFTTAPEKVGRVARGLPAHGVTSFLPTVLSTKRESYRQLIAMLQPREVSGGASILGIHLEGPFLNPVYRGAHSLQWMAELKEGSDLHAFYGTLAGVKLITLAPELPHLLEAIPLLRARNIAVALGHSGASQEIIQQALERGAQLVTHLFNAMQPFNHRRPSLIDAALIDPGMNYSLICDGVHLDAQAVKIAWSLNSKGLILVSDMMGGREVAEGTVHLGSQEVDIRGGAAYIAGSSTLAGSLSGLDGAVRLLHRWTGCSLAEAVGAATFKPAKLLGIADRKGVLDVGADADILLLDDELHVRATFIGGHACFPPELSTSNIPNVE